MNMGMYQPAEHASRVRTRLLWAAVVSALVIAVGSVAFVGGFFLGHSKVGSQSITRFTPGGSAPARLVDEVNTIIEREALRPSSDTSLSAGAVSGLLRSLDDTYAAYFDQKSFKQFNEQNEGSFVGVGITITDRGGKPVVVNTIKGSPAARAGMKPQDEIVSIDGVTKHPWVIDDVVSRVRGRQGTKVTLVVRRPSTKRSHTFVITRQRIDLPNYESEMIGSDVGYVRLYSFNEPSGRDVGTALKELEGKGAKGFVLDLRDNPGGLLDAAVDVTSLFIPRDKPVVRVDERDGPEQVESSVGGFKTDKPVIVLINGDSASASEIVAGALQDYDRARLVGVKSFGKGSVQTIEQLTNGGAIKLTTAHYLTPNKRSIDKKGLVPDVVVEMDPQLQADKKKDVQLTRAVKELRGEF